MDHGETQRLAALKALQVLDTPAHPAIDRLVSLAGSLFDVPICLVSLVDADRQWFKARLGLDAVSTPRSQAFCAHTIEAGPHAVMVVEDATLDPRFADNPLVTGAPDIRFYAGATLTTQEGFNLGTLCVIDDKPRARPSEAELEHLKVLARIVVDEFELSRALRETREKQRLLEIAESMSGVGHWRLDLTTNKATWSDAVYAIHGVSRDAFDPGLDDAIAFYHPDDREIVSQHLAAAIAGGTGFDFNLRLIRTDGALRHVVSKGVCELGTHGEPVAIIGLFQDVTDTIESVNALRDSNERYRLLTEGAGDVISRFDLSGTLLYLSPAIERILGYPADVARGLGGSMHPEDLPIMMAIFEEMARGLSKSTIQHRSLHQDGRYVWLETSLQLVCDETGAPMEVICVSRDISDRKALELETLAARDVAREQAQRALLAEDIAGVGYWRYEIATARLVISPKMFDIYGLEPVDAPRIEDFNALIHPDDRTWTLARIAQRLKTGEPDFNVLTRIVRPNGEERCVSGSSIVETDADGAPQVIVGTVRDITDEQAASLNLARSEARYRLLAENANDMIAQFGPTGDIQFISPGCQKVVGYAPEELIGRRVIDMTHPDDKAHLSDYYAALIARGPMAESEPFQFRGRHKNGDWVWLEGQPKLFFDRVTGKLAGIQDVVRDVTRRKALEFALDQARTEAEAAAGVKADFLSNMSHELRTPLTAVLGFSRLIAEQPELSPSTRRFVDRVSHAGKALLSTVNDILDFSKLEAGQVEIVAAPCDPRQVLADALDLFSVQAQEKGIALHLGGLEDLPDGLALASDRVRQILLNLVGNAVKFTDRGHVTLLASHDATTATLRVEVIDTGAGIAADRLDRLFKRFSQIDGASTRKQGGTGLGLAICKGLVEAMGGQIGACSREGLGSSFWFEIPAPLADVEGDAQDEAPSLTEGCRVLVTDDNAVNRDLVGAVLRSFGVALTEAEHGEAAVNLAARQPFDVILMDLRMPGMGGAAAARMIRQTGGLNTSTPIIAFSADVSPDLTGGLFDGLVTKPLDAMGLVTEIMRTLNTENRMVHAA